MHSPYIRNNVPNTKQIEANLSIASMVYWKITVSSRSTSYNTAPTMDNAYMCLHCGISAVYVTPWLSVVNSSYKIFINNNHFRLALQYIVFWLYSYVFNIAIMCISQYAYITQNVKLKRYIFWHASGPTYCMSLPLMMQLQPYIRYVHIVILCIYVYVVE